MLTEILCNKFAQTNIQFHKGLNVIAGDDNASNSIGKSSALLAIEFTFGGSTYAKQIDIIENVGHHDICFCHEFNGTNYYFKRNTSQLGTIYVCNAQYEVIEECPIDRLYSILLENYRINHNSLSFRDFVGLFSRIYGKDNLNERKPLDMRGGEAGNAAITRLIKMFNEYEAIKEQKMIKEQATKDFNTFKAAQGLRLVNPNLSKKDRKEKEAEIFTFDTAIDNITNQLSSMSVDLDNQQIEAISIQKQQQHLLEALLSRQKFKLSRLQRSLWSSKDAYTIDTAQLALYFPTIDIVEVDKINEFHGKLTNILKTKILSEIKICQSTIAEYNNQMDSISKEIERILNCKNPVTLAVDNLIKLRSQRDKLVKALDDSDKYNQYSQNKKTAASNLTEMIRIAITNIQQLLNSELATLCNCVTPLKNPPQFALRESAYDFYIPNDTGAGSKYKSTIITDLSFMNLTDLPFVIHDTVLFKNIEDDTMENIILQYASYKEKQVFIAFDHISSYSKVATTILRENTVLDIIPGGRELYGKSWNVK